MDITPLTSAAASGQTQASAPTDASSVLTSDFETFLQMMTAQAKFQDPLDPMDSSEYASQLAQFSMVEQQVKTNELLGTLSGALGGSSMAGLSQWIGMEALSTAPLHFGGAAVSVEAPTVTGADQRFLVVRDTAGAEAQRMEIPDGLTRFDWTGVSETGAALPAGQYTLTVESMAKGELLSVDQAAHYARITEARVAGSDTVLVFDGGGSISATEISGLREPVTPLDP